MQNTPARKPGGQNLKIIKAAKTNESNRIKIRRKSCLFQMNSYRVIDSAQSAFPAL
jgi:hypothetical protein